MNFKEKFFKLGLTTTLSIFLGVQFLGAFAFARPANAQIVAITQKNPVVEALLSVGKVGIMTGISHFTRKIAFDTAKYIGSGGKGQSAQFFTNGFGDYLKNTAGDSLGHTIDAIGSETGVNLCQFPDLKLQAGFLAGLQTQLEIELAPDAQFNKPNCDWHQFSEIWLNPDTLDRVQSEIGVSGMLQMYSSSLNPMNNDFGVALKQIKLVEKKVSDSKAAAELARLEGEGVKPVEGKISNKIKTPSFFTKEEAKGLTTRDTVKNAQQQTAGLYAADEVAILPMALGVFVNTLASTLLNKTLSEGLFSEGSGGGAGSSAVTDFYAENLINNRKAVEKAFNFLFTAVPSKQLSAYDILSEFTACPDIAGLNNCVIDNDFKEAIDRANLGDALTIKEALDEGLLKREWPLYSPLRTADNTDPKCRERGYCYSNLQKLRKVRILPSGLEIAALKSDPDQPWTLGEVVDGFYDKTKSYYKLVNPNWVLRLPQVRCESKVSGPVLETADGKTRRQECVDLSTCITEGPNGECIDEKYYAYCTKEKNTWHIGSNTCEPEFNTCKAYVDNKGEARSYLSRTVDAASCTAEEVGCSVFSLERDGSVWTNSGEVDLARKKAGQNQVIHFNRNIINESCPPESDGCTAFYTVAKDNTGVYKKTGNQLNLKKAPDHLGCYDTNLATVKVDYPQNKVQLNTLLSGQDSACLGYSQVCLEEELGCQLYAPSAGGATVPGIVGANACNSECAGYDAYKQEATQFTKAEYPLYFIPSQADQCQAEHAGCSEFTNLETEGAEFYSKIKYCEKPAQDNSNQKTYYSWEGDKTNGYILRTHNLRPLTELDVEYLQELELEIDGDIGAIFSPFSPAYADDSQLEIQKNHDTCNEASYNNLIKGLPEAADPDCRAIYDDQGLVSYRLLSKTITVSDQCQVLRKTNPEFFVDTNIGNNETCINRGGVFNAQDNTCQRCLGGGEFKDGSCIYNAMATESTSCPAAANNCREFSGNTGNNIAVINSADFEPGDGSAESINIELAPWKSNGSISIAAESLQVGLNSLQIKAKELRWNIDNSTIVKNGDWFELTFWTRGVSQSLNIDLEVNSKKVDSFTKDVQTGASKAISISDSWTAHRVGPIQVTSDAKDMVVVFKADNSNAYFLDTVRLKKLTDTSFLIRDSWKDKNGGDDVPFSCDNTPENIFPGKFLGCTAYNDVDGRTITATGFEQLCRQEAIGCAPLVDTLNTLSGPSAQDINIYKASCILPQGKVSNVTNCVITYNDVDLGNCNVQIGNDRCTVDQISVKFEADVTALDVLTSVEITKSSVVIPADNLETEPVFLTTNPQYRCSEQHLGCMVVAKEEKGIAGTEKANYTFSSDIALKNNPDKYNGTGGILCSEDSVGCGEFKTDTGVTYFRDPKQTGNALCVYQERNEIGGNNLSGWFKKDVGTCSNNPSVQCREDSSEADCGAADLCTNVGKVSCYNNYIEAGGDFGIWSNKSANYQGLVGECPIEANTCSELVDPQDTSEAFPTGKPYYVLFDEQVKEKISECSGGVSLEEGCVLFDRTELPNKTYNSKLTYQASSKVNGKVVSPSGGNNTTDKPDTNIILKVDRDRSCSEWLSCKTSITQVNEVGIPQKLCVDFRACDQVENGVCINWTDTDIGKEFLSTESYQARDTSWYGEEYTGYSLFNKFQITNYDYLNIQGKDYVVYKMDSAYFEDEDNEEFSCLEKNTQAPKKDWETSCGFGKTGRCFSGDCVFPVDGPFPDNVDAAGKAASAIGDRNECKAFPEKDSPFSPNVTLTKSKASSLAVFNEYPSRKSGFENANVCQDGSCSCEYTKVQYKNNPTFSYWQTKEVDGQKSKKDIKKSVCVGGEKDGESCDSTAANSCGTAGTCSIISKQQTHIGFKGYCLEEDRSRLIDGGLDKDGNAQYACLTWLPIEVSASGFDNYNNFQAAGYSPAVDSSNGGEVYCLDSAAGGAYLSQKEGVVVDGLSNGVNFGISFTDALNVTPKVHINTDSTDYKNIENIGLQAWFDQKLTRYTRQTGDIAHSGGAPNSLVWYMDNPKYIKNYFKSAFDAHDATMKTRDLDCGDPDENQSTSYSGGPDAKKKTCNAIHYFAHIAKAKTISNTEISLEKKTLDVIFKNQIKRIYFSPFIAPYNNDDSSGFASAFRYYDSYNALYLDFDEVNSKAAGTGIAHDYPMNYSASKYKSSLGGKKYEVYQGKNTINDKTRYVTIVNFSQSKIKTDFETLMKTYLESNEVTSNLGQIEHSVIVVEFDKDEKLVMDGNRPFKLFDPKISAFYKTETTVLYDTYMKDHSVVGSSVVFRPLCTELASVYKDVDSVSESSNKAYTNRVWKDANPDVLKNLGGNYADIDINTGIRPAGSINIKTSDLKTPSELYSAVFQNLEASGVPHSCESPALEGIARYKSIDYTGKGQCYALKETNGSSGYSDKLKESIFGNLFTNLLDNLYAQVFDVYKRDNKNKFKKSEGDDNSQSVKTTFAPRIYSINPANCFDQTKKGCGVGDWDNITINGRNGTRLDYDGDGVSDEDPQGNGQHEAIIAKKAIGTVMNFFAAVDDDQLPIKRVMVDWGDTKVPQNVNRYGLYKNHKPYCQLEDNKVQDELGYCAHKKNDNILFPTVTCNANFGDDDCKTLGSISSNVLNDQYECRTIKTATGDNAKNLETKNVKSLDKEKGSFINSTRFGNAPRACQPNYFEYTHSYTCPKDEKYRKTVAEWRTIKIKDNTDNTDKNKMITEQTRLRLSTLGVGSEDSVCVYKPKVQILDNWGYCNGDCGDGIDGGCYGEEFQAGKNQCKYKESIGNPNINAWTEYQGSIIVIPN